MIVERATSVAQYAFLAYLGLLAVVLYGLFVPSQCSASMNPQHCLPPIVKLITPVGAIHIEGEKLEFGESVSPFFLEAGFTGVEAGDGRRRLGAASLTGFFNALQGLTQASAANASGAPTCLPTLPSQPRYLRSRSNELKLCKDDCVDGNGFTIPNLAGVQKVKGRPFVAFEESTAINTVRRRIDPSPRPSRAHATNAHLRMPSAPHPIFDHATPP